MTESHVSTHVKPGGSSLRSRFGILEWKASPYLYVAPFFILFMFVGLVPLIYTVWVAMRQYNTLTGDAGWAVCGSVCHNATPGWTGNFLWVLHQPSFYAALRNSLSIFLISTIPQMILALLLAWVLNANLKAKTFWRMGVLLPYVVAPSAAGIIFSQIFSDKMGAINVLLQTIGLPTIMWHGSAIWSHIAIATIVNFRWTGYNALIFLAAMQAIPNDVMEAAVVDGAGKARTFFSVTLPLLRPTLIFVIINSTIGGLQIFDEAQLFHNGTSGYGGPNQQYLTISMYLWTLGFNNVTIGQPNMGRAAAVAWFLFVIIVVIALLNYWLTKRLTNGSGARNTRQMAKTAKAVRFREYEQAVNTGVVARLGRSGHDVQVNSDGPGSIGSLIRHDEER